MCACTCVVTQHMTSTQRTTKSSRTWLMARRRVVGNEPKGDVGEYSTISIKNIICNNSREIKDFTKKLLGMQLKQNFIEYFFHSPSVEIMSEVS